MTTLSISVQQFFQTISPEHWLIIAFGGVLGLFVGSFIYLYADRLIIIRQGGGWRALMTPGSRCDHCGTPLRPTHLIPLVSFFIQGGKARCCGKRLSPVHPIAELAAALLVMIWLAVFASSGNLIGAFFPIIASLMLLAMGLCDLKHRLLPNVLTLPLVALGLAWPFLGGPVVPLQAAIGAALGFFLLWGADTAYGLIRGQSGLGGGDMKLAAALGAFSGPFGIFVIIFGASLGGALFGVVVMMRGKAGFQTALAFGPWLCLVGLLWLIIRNSPI